MTLKLAAEILITLPAWLRDDIEHNRLPEGLANPDEQVKLAIDLSRRNVEHQSGGPFGAIVVDDSGRIVGLGVNRSVPCACSFAHAEVQIESKL